MKTSTSFDRRTGITYVYEIVENHWDPEKKRGHPVRRLIGKIDPDTGQIVPTGKRGRPPGSGKKTSTPPSGADSDSPDWKQLYESAAEQLIARDAQIASLRARLEESEKEKDKILQDLSDLIRHHQ